MLRLFKFGNEIVEDARELFLVGSGKEGENVFHRAISVRHRLFANRDAFGRECQAHEFSVEGIGVAQQ